ncbi:MAG: IclR family transcriptional regulator [Hyphomicrobiaceae bacterium]|nr:IclR family transcriptional regulator [Hyphomicrobiaceae bacterium]
MKKQDKKPVLAGQDGETEATDRLSALEKSMLVLEAIVDHPQPVSLPELTLRLGMPRQTIHRLLQQLSENGLILRDASRDRYSVGPRLSHLAFATLRSRNQTAPVRAILAELVDETGETCNVGVLDGWDFVYLERIECEWSLRVHLVAGSRVRAHSTSGGKIMLAYMDADIRKALFQARRLEAFTPNTITSLAKLEQQFEAIRQMGYALNDKEQNVGIVGVAVPIMDGTGNVLAALALHGPESRLSAAKAVKFVPALKAAAKKLAAVWTH